ncbi:MAG: D-alanyl-D-alanine carboxypeptidase [Chloroflexi bacterium]|nr:D-alanyl-D-alanine carboxypeptidase [Chloroflexota bacterium]
MNEPPTRLRPPPAPYSAVRTRRGIPLPLLVFATVLPALLVSAVIVWQQRGPADALSPDTGPALISPITTGLEDGGTGAVAEDEADREAGGDTTNRAALTMPGAAPEAATSLGPGPSSLGIPVPEVSAAAAIVVDDASLAVLYDKDGYTPRPPASVTKMATAVVALEHGRLDDVATSSLHFWDLALEDGSTMGLEPGDQVTIRELLYGLMLVSGNDAAETIAEHVTGSEEAFVAEMNALADRLGMESTRFTNPVGLSEPGHVSSPWDLMLLGRYLMRFPDLREIVATEQHIAGGLRNGEVVEFDLYNHNPLLNYTDGVDGLKTGFTEQSGRTFALTAERSGHRIYIVLMDTTLRAQDAIALVEWAFGNHVWPGNTEPPSGAPAAETATN